MFTPIRAPAAIQAPSPPASHQGEVLCCAFSTREDWVVTGGWDGQVLQWDRRTGQVLTSWRAGEKPITAVAVSPDGRLVLTGSMEGLLGHWEVATQRRLSLFLAHTRPISAIRFSRDGGFMATSSWDGQVIVWNLEQDRSGRPLIGHQDIVAGCDFLPHGRKLLSWSYDGTLRLWEVAGGRELLRWSGHEDRIVAGAVSPDGRWFASASRDGAVIVWDAANQQEAGRHQQEVGEIRGCFFSSDAELLFVICSNGQALVLPVPDLQNESKLETGLNIQAFGISWTGEQMALGTSEGGVHFLRLEATAGRPVYVMPIETQELRPGMLARLLGRKQVRRVIRCTCPLCQQTFELARSDGRTAVCPECKRRLRVNSFRLSG